MKETVYAMKPMTVEQLKDVIMDKYASVPLKMFQNKRHARLSVVDVNCVFTMAVASSNNS